MTIDPLLAIASFGIGIVVGLTGMGGGALMTPVLVLFFNVAPLAAVSSRPRRQRRHEAGGLVRPSAARHRPPRPGQVALHRLGAWRVQRRAHRPRAGPGRGRPAPDPDGAGRGPAARGGGPDRARVTSGSRNTRRGPRRAGGAPAAGTSDRRDQAAADGDRRRCSAGSWWG